MFIEFDEEPEEFETGAGAAPPGRGIGRICMLFRCNYLALVGGGRAPRFARDQLVLWNAGRRGTPLQMAAVATLEAPDRLPALASRDDPSAPALPAPAHSRPPVRNLCLSKERCAPSAPPSCLVFSCLSVSCRCWLRAMSQPTCDFVLTLEYCRVLSTVQYSKVQYSLISDRLSMHVRRSFRPAHIQ